MKKPPAGNLWKDTKGSIDVLVSRPWAPAGTHYRRFDVYIKKHCKKEHSVGLSVEACQLNR